jgi:GDP-D-mannose dehydratase
MRPRFLYATTVLHDYPVIRPCTAPGAPTSAQVKAPTGQVFFGAKYLRPTEVDALIGDASKAERVVGWRASVRALELARIMVDADIAELK